MIKTFSIFSLRSSLDEKIRSFEVSKKIFFKVVASVEKKLEAITRSVYVYMKLVLINETIIIICVTKIDASLCI